MNRRRCLALTAIALLVSAGSALTTGAVASSDNGQLVGAGSTLVAPLMTNWSSDFEARYSVSVTYGAVGSGAGIAQITARTVDFGASDAPLTGDQATACGGCVQVPWALTATGVAFHLNGVKKLNLSPVVIAQIYQGQITKWNDKRITKLNKGVKLPGTAITPVFRSDGSGDTYAFTDLLARVSPSWKSKIGTSTAVTFPKGVGGKGNDGVTAVVKSTNGSIAYIAASYIINHGLSVAALQNRAGKFVFPNLKNIQAAASVVKSVPANNELHIVNPPKSKPLAYPLSTFSYAIVPKSSPKSALLKKLLLYGLTTGQKFGAPLDFATVPGVVLKAGTNTANSLQQG
jgi:phosphate transport system substrate-binding protein